ncbi:AAA family ATPase [Chitinophaga sp.]|uniref:AAA family ATPase n=1 Tax=Chitinophaga sp. TaxID=1869181 RepID=UPI0031E00D1B
MANNGTKSPTIIINQLRLVGIRKDYTIFFHTGLNIINGDSDTGKSSILDLIDYCLGGHDIDMYDELRSSGKYCLLEVSLNGKIYTIKRDIFEPNQNVEVYSSTIDDMVNVFPKEYSPNFSRRADEGFISDFFLDALSIPKIEIKQAPSKPDSKMIRLSFRDILKFNILSQDDVGSKQLLDSANFAVAVKNQETFKFIHNLLDINIAELNALISEKSTAQKALEQNYKTISTFFRETNLKTKEDLNAERARMKESVNLLDEQIESINQNMKADTRGLDELRNIKGDLEKHIKVDREKIENLNIQMRQHILLKNDYLQDINKLDTAIRASRNGLPHDLETPCPVCDNALRVSSISEKFQQSGTELLEKEIKSVKNRMSGIAKLIDESRNEIILSEIKIAELNSELEKVNVLLDTGTSEIISPYLSQRDGYTIARAQLLERIDQIEYTLKIRNQLNEISNQSAKLELELAKLHKDLEELKSSTPTTTKITARLADILNDFLTKCKMNNVTGISVNERTFMPIVRNMEYHRLTSGGVRTLVSVGYFISLLKNGLETTTNHPNFLMIDTIGKYLGKTSPRYLGDTNPSEDKREGFGASDPTKYLNMYNYILDLCTDREDIQIIVVDNDIPPVIQEKLRANVVKEFSNTGLGGLPIGFIDDSRSFDIQ